MSVTRTALRESVRFEASLVTPVVGLVAALPVVAVFAIGLAFFTPREAISLAVGANLIAVVSLVGAPRLSLSLALVDASAMAIAVVLEVATASITWLHVVLLLPLCFAAGLVTVLGITQGVIGTQAIIAYVVLGRFAGSFLTALQLGLLVLIDACHRSLGAVALHFTDGAARRWEDLRPIYRAAEDQLATDGAAPSVAVHFDELVNALNTAAYLISTPATD